jgi:mevalonate kinase
LQIDEIITIANKHNVGCKITGAGFGGCLLVIYNALSDVQAFKADIDRLSDKNVSFIDVEFNKDGVQCDSWLHH